MPASPAVRPLTALQRVVLPLVIALVAALLPVGLPVLLTRAAAADPCAPLINAVACENSKPGSPASEWDIEKAGDDSIQGFATEMSTNAGQAVRFKIDTNAANYSIRIYRTGWYQGLGARKIADVTPSALRQSQPQCLSDNTTELYDCGTWAVSATWQVPADAVSGVYVALLTRPDTGGQSHITFIVRNDGSRSNIVFQTSDTTWQAYNTYGGADFYQGAVNGRAYKISYNRPFATRGDSEGRDFYFSNEYPLVRFLEKNGYDVSYISGLDTDRSGALLRNHKVFLSVGHDEYWSGAQRTNVEAARDAGVNLQFLSGNEVYWRTRYEPSPVDGAAHRTITSYKETWANGKIDPSTEWTGTWRDPRYAAPANGGGLPENALTGTIYMSNYTDLPITVSAAEGKTRLWRGTSLASLATGASAALAPHTVGYESDEDLDNGFRPAGLIRLSTTTGPTVQYLQDFGNTVQPGTTTHNLTLYRAASGALVFGAGTVQWTWGLDQEHDGEGAGADPRIQQAQINLLADMGAQPGTRDPALAAAAASTDVAGPSVTVSSPAEGAGIAHGTSVTASGTATDSGGVVSGVEVSTDGGKSWHPAQGKQNWTYTYMQKGLTASTFQVRAIDDSANIGATVTRNLQVPGPYTVFGQQVPPVPDSQDGGAYELGLKITPTVDGFITGVRFYKSSANTGTHTGSLWNAAGQRLATATFSAETTSGWQKVLFSQPVAVTAGTKYTVSYKAPNGHYAIKDYQWASFGFSEPPLTVAGGFGSEPAGVYGSADSFPTNSYGNGNYFVDAVFDTVDNTPLTAGGQWPLDGSSSVPQATTVGAVFSKPVTASTVSLTLKAADGTTVAGTTAYDSVVRKATFTPSAPLALATKFTVALSATASSGGSLTAGGTWSFTTVVSPPLPGTCPCSFYDDAATPGIQEIRDGVPLTLGLRFSSTAGGTVTGVRFYKSAGNTGTHTGSLFSAAGEQLATVTFANESTSGWQTAYFNQPVAMSANTEYVVAYKSTTGAYSATVNGFGSGLSVGNLRAASDAGAYSYSTDFPGSRSSASYLVDVVVQYPDPPFTGVNQSPLAGSSSVALDSPVSVVLSKPATASTVKLTLTGPGTTPVNGTSAYDTATGKATFTPAAALATSTTYTATLSATSTTGQQLSAGNTWTFTTVPAPRTEGTCPCTLYQDTVTPTTMEIKDGTPLTLGVRFASAADGTITGLRFYKAAGNTGTHTGTLFTAGGQQLATITFTNETTAGWQTMNFSQPVPITANTEYIAAYTTPTGTYSSTPGGFNTGFTSGPLRTTEGSGAFTYSGAFPGSSSSSSYLVDLVFQQADPPFAGVNQSPLAGSSSVALDSPVSVVLSKPATASTVKLTLTGPGTTPVNGTSAYDTATGKATFTPAAALATSTTYTATLSATSTTGQQLSAGNTWTFTTVPAPRTEGTCPCTLYQDTVTPTTMEIKDGTPLTLGVRFASAADGTITGLRFYKAAGNTGTHTGTLFTAGGQQLATITFTNETTAGWQTMNFSQPVPITANTEYIAAYTTPTGTYSATPGGFNTGFTSGPLRTTEGSGAFANGSVFPVNGSTTSYFVDVVYGGTSPSSASFTVTAQSPVQNATNVPRDVKPTLTLSSSAKPGAALELVVAGATISGASALSTDGRTITFTPSDLLPANTQVTARAVNVSSTDGAALPATSWLFTTTNPPDQTLFATLTPTVAASSETRAIELGATFRTSRTGWVTGIRFYKGPLNTGIHYGSLWNSAGSRLARVAFSNETATGWQTAVLSPPVRLTEATDYVVSYNAPVGRYSFTSAFFTRAWTSGYLTAPAARNGLFRYGSGTAVPNRTDNATNYFVDVVFSPAS
ncbi:Ig-like domain-containing protein [Arthrobacter sp. SLBN-100]|uniref:DUF4082 domain-containing protein n=1 Tax=Arthrobacter sp. SLBN-100 TaxID=2768450 RepID=UPI001174BBCD|nr:DUF4082 domain-containing protein [Arthrobacter sp. SLBN-100]TQJ66980.1 Ig-like domain-containing protein [Arthrobacter sp. SLBN-100]